MKRVIKLSIFLFLFLVSFFALNVKASKEVLYSGDVQDKTIDQIREMWPSNNPRNWLIAYKKDGESTGKKFMFWSNSYTDNLPAGTDTRGLTPGTTLEININNLNLNSSEYQDIRLEFDYITGNSTVNVIKTDTLEIYITGNDGGTYGPYHVAYYEPTGFYYYSTGNIYGREYNVVSENIKLPGTTKIDSVTLKPYANYQQRRSATSTTSEAYSSFRCAEGSRFEISAISISGYKSEDWKKPDYVTTKTLTDSQVNDLRKNIVYNMYDLATIKWTPSEDMKRIMYGELSNKTTYAQGEYYFGIPYSAQNRTTVKRFSKKLSSDKVYTVLKDNDGKQSFANLGAECAGSVAMAYVKYIPNIFVVDTIDYARNRYSARLLGNLDMITGEDMDTAHYYDKLQAVYDNNTKTSPIKDAVETQITNALATRIKANTKTIKFYSLDGTVKGPYSLVYFDKNAANNVTEGESLKLYIENISLAGGKQAKLELENYIYFADTYPETNDKLSASDVIVKFCTSTNCANATVTVSDPEAEMTTHKKQKVTATYTPQSNITRVEIYPYGTNKKTGKVLRLKGIKITSDGTEKYNITSDDIDMYFGIKKQTNEDNNKVDATYTQKLNELGNDFNENDKKTMVSRFLAKQDIAQAYMDLKPGDTFATRLDLDSGHVGYISGNTHVECVDGTVLTTSNADIGTPQGSCDAHGGIDLNKSYFIATDINSVVTNTGKGYENNYGGLITNNDYVAAKTWTPNSDYTDLQNGDIMGVKRSGTSELFMKDKNLTFYVNRKRTFETAMKEYYLPATFNVYETKQIDEPYARIDNPNTYADIANGFKGTILSNYFIESITYKIVDKDEGTTQEFREYPNHYGKDGKEQNFYGIYSLYYNTPENIQTALRDTLSSANDYLVTITAEVGEENIKVLELEPKKIKSISMKNPPTKTTYVQNSENFDPTGGEVLVTYNDDTTDTISLASSDVEKTGFSNATLGNKTITVRYQGFETSFPVEIISKQLKSISVGTPPTQTNYIQNVENFNPTGGVLTLTYNDNSTGTVSMNNSGVTFTGFDNTKLGNNTITVSYLGRSTTLPVEIINNPVESIRVTTPPSKDKYVKDSEELTLTGGVLTVTYTDTSTSTMSLDSSDIEVTGFDNTTLGTKTITVTYLGKSTTFPVEVVEKAVEEISVEEEPTKTEYIQNYEDFDPEGGVLKVVYNDGEEDTVEFTNSGVTFEGFDNTTTGTVEITVKYQGQEATFEVEIISKQVMEIEIKEVPLKKIYLLNQDELDLIGGIITVKYTDETEDTISLTSKDIEVTGFDNGEEGTIEVGVEYLGQETTFEVEVVDTEVDSVEIETPPLKSNYIINEEHLDLTGGVLKVTYKNGMVDKTSMLNKNVKATNFSNSSLGEKSVSVEYYGKKSSYKVQVIDQNNKEVEVPNTGLYSKLLVIGILILLTGIAAVVIEKRRIQKV